MLHIQCFVFSPIQENTYVLHNQSKDCLIIDPGCYTDAERDILRGFIEDNRLRPRRLLNTHCHLDHVFGNKFVAETWGLTPHLHQREEKVLQMAAAAGLLWGMPFDSYQGSIVHLKEGDEVNLGADVLQVLEAPGHSPGHLCFYSAAQGFVMGGDVLFKGSIGRTDLPGGDHATLINSIRQKLMVLPDDTVVYSGHGAPTTIGEERSGNPFING